ncbi:hypothetical protein K1719_043590 [Acacia pycnantha]|nr:hypothetical protein K1719_043590 [Acacia pycnantha]
MLFYSGALPYSNESTGQEDQETTRAIEAKFKFEAVIHHSDTRDNDMHQKMRKALNLLNLRRIFSAVFVKASVGIMAKLQRVEPYVTYGYPNLKTVKELIYKKGFAKVDNQKVPLTDNDMIEQALGKYGIVCIEDMVHEFVNVGPHFEEVARFLWPFELNKPADGLRGSKALYKDGGDTGNREDLINELINKMN